jgi:hypothetical protein
MRKITLIIILLSSLTFAFAQVGIGTTTPDASSSLEISSTNSGLLIPRISLASVVDTATIPSPATSLLVYNTNPAISFGSGVGYYYWAGTQWEKLQTLADGFWSRSPTGDLFPKTINDNIGINTTTPTSKLDVNGQVTIDQKNFGGYGGLLIKGDAPGNNYPNITFSTLNTSGNDEISAYIGGNINDNTAGNESMDLSFLTSTNGLGGLSEKMRIKDNGNIGIGNTNPSYLLDVSNRMRLRSGGDIFSTAGMWLNNLSNTSEAAFIGMDSNDRVGFFGNTGAGWGLVMNNNNGNIGIGNQNPNAPLQFSNSVVNRKIVLYDTNNNDNQYYGFGINGGMLRYQTDALGADHVFFAGANSTTSNELMRIKGTGNVGLGTTNPTEKLEVNGKIKITDGTQGNGKVLVSDANGAGTWTTTNSIKPAVKGEFIGGGGNPNSTTFVYCNTYIDLPPGKWMVFGTYLLAGSTTLPSGQSVFVRTNFQLSDTVTGANPYVFSGGLISGVLAGPTDFGIANGQTIINNNTAGTIRFYMWAGIQKYGPIPATFSMSGIGSSFWAENQLSAVPMN